jgi:phage FluMu protein Com
MIKNLLKEYRCEFCKKLLFKGYLTEATIEIKCKCCKHIWTITEEAKEAIDI